MALSLDKTGLSNAIKTALESHFDKTALINDLTTMFNSPADPKKTPEEQAQALADKIDEFVKSGAEDRASDIADAIDDYISPVTTHVHNYVDTPVGPSVTDGPTGV